MRFATNRAIFICAMFLIPNIAGATEPTPTGEAKPLAPVAADAAAEESDDDGAESAFALSLNYTLVSDYIFRGINLSEYEGEGREKPNHQLDVSLDIDLALLFGAEAESWGTLTAGAWFEWFAAQRQIDPDFGGQNLQEVDYYLSWAYELERIKTTFTLGYNFYTIANAKAFNTSEWFFSLEHNDAWAWRWLWPDNEDGVLNPSFFYAQDVELTPGGIWMEIGVSHEFELTDNLAMTPSLTMAIDHRYLDPVLEMGSPGSTRLAYLQYGLSVDYDLSAAMELPETIGELTLSGFLYFNDALGNVEDKRLIQDEFFGGVSLGWSF